MRQAVLFDEFALKCPFFEGDSECNNGYACTHKESEEGYCLCYACPLGIEAEQEDIGRTDIDWDGLCEDGEVYEGEYLLIAKDDDATQEQKEALYNYERYMHRYDKRWLDEHNIPNRFCN